jgi:hypothetical protein
MMVRRIVGLLAFVAVAVSAGAPAAYAAGEATPTLISSNVSAGGSETVSGGGCAARVSVQLQFDGVVLVTTRSTASGRYSAHLFVPVSAVPGSHRITVVCAGATGQVSNSTSVTVELARTGANAGPVVIVAAVFLALGVALVLSQSRRRRYNDER